MEAGIFCHLVDNEARGAILQCWRSRALILDCTVLEEQGCTVMEELGFRKICCDEGARLDRKFIPTPW